MSRLKKKHTHCIQQHKLPASLPWFLIALLTAHHTPHHTPHLHTHLSLSIYQSLSLSLSLSLLCQHIIHPPTPPQPQHFAFNPHTYHNRSWSLPLEESFDRCPRHSWWWALARNPLTTWVIRCTAAASSTISSDFPLCLRRRLTRMPSTTLTSMVRFQWTAKSNHIILHHINHINDIDHINHTHTQHSHALWVSRL